MTKDPELKRWILKLPFGPIRRKNRNRNYSLSGSLNPPTYRSPNSSCLTGSSLSTATACLLNIISSTTSAVPIATAGSMIKPWREQPEDLEIDD